LVRFEFIKEEVIMKTYLTILFVLIFFVSIHSIFLEELSIIPDNWICIGPMFSSPREGATSIPFFSDIKKYENKNLDYRFFTGKNIEFFNVKSKEGILSLESDTIPFIRSQNAFGLSGVLSQYYAYCEFESESQQIAIIYAGKVSSFYLNNKKFIGDIYNHEKTYTPVEIMPGKNTISFIMSGYYGYSNAYIKIYETKAPFLLNEKNSIVFDIIDDSLMEEMISIQIINTSKSDLNIEITKNEYDTIFSIEEKHIKIPYLSIKNIPLKISMKRPISKIDTTDISIVIKVDSFTSTEKIKLNVKKLKQNRKETFISDIDSSVQYYALRLPNNYSSENEYPLIISLHGAGVKAEGLVESYRETDKSIIVCPTNRGEYGFDWQEFGRLDFLETFRKIKEKYKINPVKISLTGHSMGGHGTMYIGTLYAHLFSSIVPASGWINFNTYIPQTFQRTNLFDNKNARDNINLLKDGENPLVLLKNLLNVPVLMIHGEKDDNVPVFQSRMFYDNLMANGIKTEILEYPEESHWFDIKETEGIDCIDSDIIMSFMERSQKQEIPRESYFKTFSLFVSDSSDYVKINRQKKKYERSVIETEINLQEVKINTENVKGFTLYGMNNIFKGKIKINIDGIIIETKPESIIYFGMNKNNFKQIKKELPINEYSLINYAFFSPFIIVYTTRDSFAEISRNQAIYIFNLFITKCRGICEILPDTIFTEIKNRNIIFIGIPQKKSLWEALFKEMKIEVKEDAITDGSKKYKGKSISFISCKKTKRGNLIVLFCGNSVKSQEISSYFNSFSSGIYLSEYMVFDEMVLKEGYNGIRECGFY